MAIYKNNYQIPWLFAHKKALCASWVSFNAELECLLLIIEASYFSLSILTCTQTIVNKTATKYNFNHYTIQCNKILVFFTVQSPFENIFLFIYFIHLHGGTLECRDGWYELLNYVKTLCMPCFPTLHSNVPPCKWIKWTKM